MRYLRMLSNSIAAGCLTTAYVVLQLNPSLPIGPARFTPLVTTVGVFYAVHFTVICYGLLVARQLVAREVFSPAWLSVGVLVWLGALAGGGRRGADARWLWACLLLLVAGSSVAIPLALRGRGHLAWEML